MKLYLNIFFITIVFTGSLKGQDPYESVDRLVKSLKLRPSDINELTLELTKPFSTDIEKARAIYTWISNNISFDIKKHLKGAEGNKKTVQAKPTGNEQVLPSDDYLQKILKKKKGLASDYANLFARMCGIASIKAVVVDGANRMNPRFAGKEVKKNDHYWNAAFIGEKWFIIDALSGAGIIDLQGKKFIKKFRSEYFLINPETAILSHFPRSDNYQFLKIKVKREEIPGLPVIGYGYLKFGVSEYNPQSGIFQSKENNILIIKVKFRENPEEYFIVEGSRKMETKGHKSDEGFIFLGIDAGTKRNRPVTIAGKTGEDIYDILTYKIQ